MTTPAPLTLEIPQASRAGLDFNSAFAGGVLAPLRQRTLAAYRAAAARWAQEHGRDPATWQEVEAIMRSLPEYREDDAWSALATTRQWMDLSAIEEAQRDSLASQLAAVPEEGTGRLVLNPALRPPDFYAQAEFHLVPGNYDRRYIYPLMNELPQSAVVTRRSWPEVKRQFSAYIPRQDYRRIVDFGCGVGRSTIVLKELYPDAEVIGLDLSEPELRYAHWEAERRGLAIEFRQEDAAHTSFPDGSVDLVVAYVFHHEFPPEEMRQIIREAHRILRPGGVFVNGDVTPIKLLPPLTVFMTLARQVESGAEPYWLDACAMDLPAEFRAVGFDDIVEIPPPDHPNGLHYHYYTIGTRAG